MQPDRTAVFDLDVVYCRGSRGRTTDVESTHRQLSAWLTDRLRSDYTYRLTDVHKVTPRQITAITDTTNTVSGFAGNRRAHPHFVNTHFVKPIYPRLINKRATFNQQLLAVGCMNILCHRPT